MIKKLAVALVHYPVFDRAGKKVATNITHFDIHDIARACRVYGVDRYYIIHPSREQLMFVSRVLDHWKVGPGKHFNPMRKTALTMVEPVESLQRAVEDFGKFIEESDNGQKDHLKVIATSAKDNAADTSDIETNAKDTASIMDTGVVDTSAADTSTAVTSVENMGVKAVHGALGLDFREVRRLLDENNVLLVFGTGFGLFSEIFHICDACLEPIRGYGDEDYRHLSVRSAVSICLDRLRGSW